jgi:hypothetical protein
MLEHDVNDRNVLFAVAAAPLVLTLWSLGEVAT